MNDSIGAVVVTYNPTVDKFLKNVQQYMDCCKHVVVVDNSDNLELKLRLTSLQGIEYVRLESNRGIAAAQNIGIKRLLGLNDVQNIVFFDQDSYLSNHQLFMLLQALNKVRVNRPIGLMAPTLENKQSGIISVSEAISSGSIIPVDVLQHVGLMREELFIDFVDYEWCWRARKAGYGIYVDGDIELNHQTDDPQKSLGKIVSSPFRNYYYYRNLIYLMMTNKVDIHRQWFYRMFKHTIFEIVFCTRKVTRLKYMFRGIKDGIRRRMGPYESSRK